MAEGETRISAGFQPSQIQIRERPKLTPYLHGYCQAVQRMLQASLGFVCGREVRQAAALVNQFGCDPAIEHVVHGLWLRVLHRTRLLEPDVITDMEVWVEAQLERTDMPIFNIASSHLREVTNKILRPEMTLVICHLAVFLARAPVSPMDLCRAASLGRFPYLSFFPDYGAALCDEHRGVASRDACTVLTLPAPKHEVQQAVALAAELGIPIPPIDGDTFIERYALELGLPPAVAASARALAAVQTPPESEEWHVTHSPIKTPWMAAMSHVLAAMRLLYGIDGCARDWRGLRGLDAAPAAVRAPCAPGGWLDWAADQLAHTPEPFTEMRGLGRLSVMPKQRLLPLLAFLRHWCVSRSFAAPGLDALYDAVEAADATPGVPPVEVDARAPADWREGVEGPCDPLALHSDPLFGEHARWRAAFDSVPPSKRAVVRDQAPEPAPDTLPIGTLRFERPRHAGQQRRGRSHAMQRDHAAVFAAAAPLVWLQPEPLYQYVLCLEENMLCDEALLNWGTCHEEHEHLARMEAIRIERGNFQQYGPCNEGPLDGHAAPRAPKAWGSDDEPVARDADADEAEPSGEHIDDESAAMGDDVDDETAAVGEDAENEMAAAMGEDVDDEQALGGDDSDSELAPTEDGSDSELAPAEDGSDSELVPTEDDSGDEQPLDGVNSDDELAPTEDDSGDEQPLDGVNSDDELAPTEDDSGDEQPLDGVNSDDELAPTEDDSGDEMAPAEADSGDELVPTEDGTGDEQPPDGGNSDDERAPAEADSGDELAPTEDGSDTQAQDVAD